MAWLLGLAGALVLAAFAVAYGLTWLLPEQRVVARLPKSVRHGLLRVFMLGSFVVVPLIHVPFWALRGAWRGVVFAYEDEIAPACAELFSRDWLRSLWHAGRNVAGDMEAERRAAIARMRSSTRSPKP